MTDHEADLISIAASYLPEGYVIVPVEPTLTMVVAGLNHSETIPKAYKAMIQAAQEIEE